MVTEKITKKGCNTLGSDRALTNPTLEKLTQILQNVKDRASKVERLFANCGKRTYNIVIYPVNKHSIYW
jgi:hypothetical protein